MACWPARPNEKGLVESSGKFLKINFLAGRTFRDFPDLKRQGAQWLEEVANRRVHRTTGRVLAEMFAEERARLLSLPPQPYDTRAVESVKATHRFRVHFDGNTYSAPPSYAGRTLMLKASAETVWVYDGGCEVARHSRCYGRKLDVVDPAHVQELAHTRRRLRQRALEATFRALGEPAASYLEGLVAQQLNPAFHTEKILRLPEQYGRVEVLGALEHALRYGAFGWEYVQKIVFQQRRRRAEGPKLPLRLPPVPGLDLDCPARGPAQYQDLCEEGSDDGSAAGGKEGEDLGEPPLSQTVPHG